MSIWKILGELAEWIIGTIVFIDVIGMLTLGLSFVGKFRVIGNPIILLGVTLISIEGMAFLKLKEYAKLF